MSSEADTVEKSKAFHEIEAFQRLLDKNIQGDEEWVREITRLGKKHIAKLGMTDSENSHGDADISRIEDEVLKAVLSESKHLIPGEVKIKAWKAAAEYLEEQI